MLLTWHRIDQPHFFLNQLWKTLNHRKLWFSLQIFYRQRTYSRIQTQTWTRIFVATNLGFLETAIHPIRIFESLRRGVVSFKVHHSIVIVLGENPVACCIIDQTGLNWMITGHSRRHTRLISSLRSPKLGGLWHLLQHDLLIIILPQWSQHIALLTSIQGIVILGGRLPTPLFWLSLGWNF